MTTALTETEECRDARVRKVSCPNCGAAAGSWCDFGVTVKGYKHRQPCSHTGRYLAAVASGLVPGLIGSRRFPWMT